MMNLNKYFDIEPLLSKKEEKQFKKQIKSIDALLVDLRQFPSSEIVYNQYQYKNQLYNLRNYLILHLKTNAKIVLIGEAGGYLGAKHSGIPFTSGYKIAHDSIFMKIKPYFQYQTIMNIEEKSASAFYQFFNSHSRSWESIVMWNAFPFHPHNIKFMDSNRTPSKNELTNGLEYFDKLNAIFEFQHIYPIGKKAQFMLSQKGLIADAIRHPSYGGKKEFLEQLDTIYKKLIVL